jgi:hypothetical protein
MVTAGQGSLRIFSHINRRGGASSGTAVFIAMVNDDPSLILSYYHDLQGKIFTQTSIFVNIPDRKQILKNPTKRTMRGAGVEPANACATGP